VKTYKLTIKGEKTAKVIAEKNIKGANAKTIKAIAEGKFTSSKKTDKSIAFLLQNRVIIEVVQEGNKPQKETKDEEQGDFATGGDDNVLEHPVIEAIRKGTEYDINNITKKELIIEVVASELIDEKEAKKTKKAELVELLIGFFKDNLENELYFKFLTALDDVDKTDPDWTSNLLELDFISPKVKAYFEGVFGRINEFAGSNEQWVEEIRNACYPDLFKTEA